VTYSKLLCNLNAIGASGSIIVSQAFLTSTPRIALRVTFLAVDFAPKVATNLYICQFHQVRRIIRVKEQGQESAIAIQNTRLMARKRDKWSMWVLTKQSQRHTFDSSRLQSYQYSPFHLSIPRKRTLMTVEHLDLF